MILTCRSTSDPINTPYNNEADLSHSYTVNTAWSTKLSLLTPVRNQYNLNSLLRFCDRRHSKIQKHKTQDRRLTGFDNNEIFMPHKLSCTLLDVPFLFFSLWLNSVFFSSLFLWMYSNTSRHGPITRLRSLPTLPEAKMGSGCFWTNVCTRVGAGCWRCWQRFSPSPDKIHVNIKLI